MLGLGLATSHAPSMFRGLEHWASIHRVLTNGVPQPPEIENETSEVLRDYIDRIKKGFDALKKQIEAYKPDVLLVVGDDQAEVFTEANMPPFCLFTCSEVHGSINISLIEEPEDENHITLRCHSALDRWVLKQLESANGEALCHLFEFDSDTLRGGTGEIRSWIVVAGACSEARATIVDYIPAHHAVTGLGFAFFNLPA